MQHALFRILCAILLASASLVGGPQPAQAQTGSASAYAGEQCVTFRREGNDSFRLVNDCAEPLSVAVCAENAGSGDCSRDTGWQTLNVAARAELPGSYLPLQSLNIFACRAPAVVILQAGGLGRCDPTGTGNLPLLLASSLKNAASIITAADYPRGVVASGTTRFEMVVAADGRPQSCTITVSSGKEALDKATCNAFMKRARFTPAKGTNGVAISGRYRGNVTWKEQ
ncbi:MAG: TonB family protein [Sphingomonadales bacterium]|nr:TonB family protein [Sphingomonadales bacterium]MBK9004331.1 TonB family protein [Sphingomonadales bacterium]MBK9269508.1 TonB family protein [Sphingomonadales bacterium]MBP6435087.1 TonB family protein [Sphingorhabdus sp.]